MCAQVQLSHVLAGDLCVGGLRGRRESKWGGGGGGREGRGRGPGGGGEGRRLITNITSKCLGPKSSMHTSSAKMNLKK